MTFKEFWNESMNYFGAISVGFMGLASIMFGMKLIYWVITKHFS